MRLNTMASGPQRPLARACVSFLLAIGLVAAGQVPVLAGGSPASAPAGAAATAFGGVTSAAVPPKPYSVLLKTLKIVRSPIDGSGYAKIRVTWKQKSGTASSFRLFGLTRCVRASAANHGKPCIVTGTHLKASDLDRIATYGSTVRSATLHLTLYGSIESNQLYGDSGYYGLLLGAYKGSKQSVLTIVKSSKVCWGCTY